MLSTDSLVWKLRKQTQAPHLFSLRPRVWCHHFTGLTLMTFILSSVAKPQQLFGFGSISKYIQYCLFSYGFSKYPLACWTQLKKRKKVLEDYYCSLTWFLLYVNCFSVLVLEDGPWPHSKYSSAGPPVVFPFKRYIGKTACIVMSQILELIFKSLNLYNILRWTITLCWKLWWKIMR